MQADPCECGHDRARHEAVACGHQGCFVRGCACVLFFAAVVRPEHRHPIMRLPGWP